MGYNMGPGRDLIDKNMGPSSLKDGTWSHVCPCLVPCLTDQGLDFSAKRGAKKTVKRGEKGEERKERKGRKKGGGREGERKIKRKKGKKEKLIEKNADIFIHFAPFVLRMGTLHIHIICIKTFNLQKVA